MISKSYFLLFLFIIYIAYENSYAEEKVIGLQEEEISFSTDGFTLNGVLVKPEGNGPFPVVIFIHGDGPIDRTFLGYYVPIWKKFIKIGYACMSWDKPGVEKSTGTFRANNLFQDRASIVTEAVKCLRSRKDIDKNCIGFWGISQAGYIMTMATSVMNDIAFMIAVSCPGVNSIEQGAYLIEKQLLNEGLNAQEAKKFAEYYIKSRIAKSHNEYFIYAEKLSKQPYLIKLGWADVIPRDKYVPPAPDNQSFFNPVSIVEKITFPVLAVFGEKDTQIPPAFSAEAYRQALHRAGNKHFKVIIFPNADHVIFNTKTGSLKEWEKKFMNKQMDYAPGYLDTMTVWLKNFSKR